MTANLLGFSALTLLPTLLLIFESKIKGFYAGGPGEVESWLH